MTLDIRTMIVMTSVLTLLLSVFLSLASMHAGNMRGIRSWALASLSIGVGLGLAFMQVSPDNLWAIVVGATLIALGMSLQWAGVRAFRGLPRQRRRVVGIVLLVLAGNWWFTQIDLDIQQRAIFNSIVFAVVNLASARTLLVNVTAEQRTAYWFTGGVFLLVGLLFLVRAFLVAKLPAGSYGLYANVPINPATFFVASIAQLTLTFGFMHMMHCSITEELHKLASRDSLTGAYNRRSMEEEFQRLRALHQRNGEVLAVVMIDIDHFKAVNDEYGHLAGDEVLRQLSELAQSMIRRHDYFARYGGEEFCLLLPATRAEEAGLLAARLRLRFSETRIVLGRAELTCTISLGIADSSGAGLEFEALVGAGDQALYRAKQDGRNRVVLHSELL